VLDAAARRLLTADEAKLIEQTSVAALDKKTLDEVGAIYDRVRKGRDKYRGLHRRQASNQVRRDHARGTGANKNLGSSSKYEIFEEALGRVSKREADLAKQSAGELKKARLIAAAAEAAAAKSAAPVPPRAKKAAAKKAPAKKAAAPAGRKTAAKTAAPAKKAVPAAPARATKGPAPKSKSATSKVRSSVSRSNQARTQARRDGR
jgi:hypothetical protein